MRKELDALRDNYSKAEEIFKAAKKTYDEESALLNDLRDKFRSVDTIRQEAYAQLQTLKKQAFEKVFISYLIQFSDMSFWDHSFDSVVV